MLVLKPHFLSGGTPCAGGGDHTTNSGGGGLLAVCPDVAELLAVVTLRKSILGFVCLYPDSNVAEVVQLEQLLCFRRSRQGYEE
jgi:hypothetical protein